MSPIDPGKFHEIFGQTARESLSVHYDILVRTGFVALFAGLIGGSIAYFLSGQRRAVFGWRKQLFLYLSKIGIGCFAAYLSILSLPLLGLAVSPGTEQIISILAAILGSDFISFLINKIFGQTLSRNKEVEKDV